MKVFKIFLFILGILFASVLLQIPLTLAVFTKGINDWLRMPILLGLGSFLYFILWKFRAHMKIESIPARLNPLSLFKVFSLTLLVLGLEIVINLILAGIFHVDLDMSSRHTIENVLFSKNFLLIFISLHFLAPASEELLFRGIFQEYLLQHFPKQAIVSILSCAFLFAFAHTYDFLSIKTYLMMISGICFSYIYWKNRDIRWPIFSHALYNLAITILTLLFK
ncbi:CPBP family intramembrane glutamic endopeptidase [Streptococcus panodentis]|uniref:CAAX prenyl protease 2/Lysostaphin resistance protein A-like domain-containing protein n=1 Tax=Streptococcus panodentis TaxID=1581472 RepID=A0ABS5AZ82_9STRE|nr:CPBP family intramembrane glutamic endopeptidase [Streptococcus panodentis]MBP2621892.1 hypothetical protein [Streptococcus panodentis]